MKRDRGYRCRVACGLCLDLHGGGCDVGFGEAAGALVCGVSTGFAGFSAPDSPSERTPCVSPSSTP